MLEGVEKIKFQKVAFTLAEVLITLGIVGVIAALTIPAIVHKQQKQETVTRLQKIYSVFVQAVKFSEMENGPMIHWDLPASGYTNNEQTFDWWNKYFIPYSNLSVIQSGTATEASNFWASGAKFLDGAAMSPPARLYQRLKDGSVIAYASIGSNGDAQTYVDINGFKKPNIVGKDIFLLNIWIKQGYAGFTKAYSRNTLLTDPGNAMCNKLPSTYKGAHCGALIQLDGWQIKDDYPW